MEIARLERLKLRDVWPHEAHDFTTWLEKNLDVLNQSLPFDLQAETVRREEAAGDFSVDLVIEDADGRLVVVENQLGRSDHDHLGKLLTYLSFLGAKTAIWIVGEPRPEHVSAVSWLNDSLLADFYLFKIEVVRIAVSPAAPVLTLIVGPNQGDDHLQLVKQEISNRDVSRLAFFTQLIEYAATRTKLHSGRSASAGPYLGGSSGFPGIYLNYGVSMHATSVIIWIEKGKDYEKWNQAVYEYLDEHKDSVENAFGDKLEWEAKEKNRSRKLIFRLSRGGWMDPNKWDDAILNTVNSMINLETAVHDFLGPAVSHANEVLVPEVTE